MHNGGLNPCSSSWQWLLLMTASTEESSKWEDRNKQGESSHHCWYSFTFILQDTGIWLMIPVFTIEDTTKEAENEERCMHMCLMVCPAAKLCRVLKWDSIFTPLLAIYTTCPFSASVYSDGEERIELDPSCIQKLLQGHRLWLVYILIDTTGLFSLDYLPAIIAQHRDVWKCRSPRLLCCSLGRQEAY